jgi:protein-S-isoprenylcysteine O-methyltransferase Ste14
MTNERRGPLPPVLLLAALLLQWGAHALWPIARVVPNAWTALGVVPIVAGLAVMIGAARQFKMASTEINPFGKPSKLVQGGPFRYSRNPMYLAMLLILVGAAVAWGTISPFIFPPLFGWLLTVRFIVMEELKMARIFGVEYEEYQSQVRRWL